MIGIKEYILLTVAYFIAMYLTTNSDGILQPIEIIKVFITSVVYLGTIVFDKRKDTMKEMAASTEE